MIKLFLISLLIGTLFVVWFRAMKVRNKFALSFIPFVNRGFDFLSYYEKKQYIYGMSLKKIKKIFPGRSAKQTKFYARTMMDREVKRLGLLAIERESRERIKRVMQYAT